MRTVTCLSASDPLHVAFLALLPRIESHARMYFRAEKCPGRKADRIAEVLGLAWRWYRRLVERGKDPSRFAVVLANFACRAVKCGRRVCGQEKPRDVLSPRAQQRHGFSVGSLPGSTATAHEHLFGKVHGQRALDAFEERLQDNRKTAILEQVVFRLDFPAWRKTRRQRDRRIIDHFIVGERTQDVSRKFHLSPSRVSQLRRQFHDDWSQYGAEQPC